jgi:hypothetical protein
MGGNEGSADEICDHPGCTLPVGHDRAGEGREVKRFFVTFGPGHRRFDPITVSHEGWVEVRAIDELEARQLIISELGRKWSFIYTEEEFQKDKNFYAQGCLAVLTKDGFEGINAEGHRQAARPA